MKNLYLLLAFSIYSITLTAQNCVSLGCAGTYTVTTNGAQADEPSGPEWGCYSTFPRKQTFWQYFYSPAGGNYTQSVTTPADLDWVVFDMGISLPSITCPVNPTGWTQVLCNTTFTGGAPTGPGVGSTVPTTAGHYYAVAFIFWENTNTTFTFGTPQLGGTDIGVANCPATLPARLQSFTAAPSGNSVLVQWVANNEVNLSHYEVEHSTNGTKFSTVGSRAATNTRSYSLMIPSAGAALVYYRLKTVDLDGKFTYSDLITFNKKTNTRLLIGANPVTNNLNISGLKQGGLIKIVDLSGKVLIEKKVQAEVMILDVSFMYGGMYLLQYTNENDSQTRKFLKK